MIIWMIVIAMHVAMFFAPLSIIGVAIIDVAWLYMIFSVPRNRAYGRYVWIHKLRVYQAGRQLGLSAIRLILHDWDKLLPSNWLAYSEQFYTYSGYKTINSKEYSQPFKQEWNAHQKKNRHHWQYHIMTWDHGGEEVLEMSFEDAMEMLADWVGAGCAIKGTTVNKGNMFEETREWYRKNSDNMKLHDSTRALIEEVMQYDAPEQEN